MVLNTWRAHTRTYNTIQRTEVLLLSMLERAIEGTYLTGIHNDSHGFGTRSLRDVFQHLIATYGSIGPDELLANQTRLFQPVDPNAPLSILWKQIKDCQKLASAGSVPLTPQQVIQAAQTLILQTGKYTQAYREWSALDITQKTYPNLKVRFNGEYQLQNAINVTSSGTGYHANVAYDTDGVHEDASLASAAQDFAASEAARSTAFEQLTTTNGDLTAQFANMAMQNQQLQHQMVQLQQQVMYMATAAPPARNGGRGGRGNRNNGRAGRPSGGPSFQQPTQYQTPPYQQPPAYQPTMQYAPPPPQQQGNQPGNQSGTATQTPPGFQAPGYPPTGYNPAQQQQAPPPFRGGPPYQPTGSTSWMPPGMQQQQQQQQPGRKRYNNMNYCWTHGGDITDEHTGQTCQRPGYGHQHYATRQNTMNGATKGLAKIWMGPAT